MTNHRQLRRKNALSLAVSMLILCLASSLANGQMKGSGHTILGDFKVDESQAEGAGTRTYQLILYNSIGNAIDRQSIANNGRFRFFDVPNGEYAIAVEFDGKEVTRIPLRFSYAQRTDIRQDISLEWKAESPKSRGGKGSNFNALPLYARPRANQEIFINAEKAAAAKQYADAAKLLGQIVDSDPKDYEAWIEMGNAYFNLGKLKDAEKAYLRAIDEQPAFVLPYLNLGKTRLAANNYEGAIDALNNAIKFQPASAEANYFLGESYLQIKKGSKAVGYLNEALRLEPIKMAEAHLRLAALYNGAGLKDKAAAEYESFLKVRPDYPDRKKLEKYISDNKKP